MNNIFKTFVLAALLLAPAGMADAQKLSVGIRIGEPPPARAYRVPPQPGADYEWVEGYQYPGRRPLQMARRLLDAGHPIRERTGLSPIMWAGGTMPVVGKAPAAWSPTIIDGTLRKGRDENRGRR